MLSTRRTIDAPAAAAWGLLTDLDRWPQWGPSVRSATLDGDEGFVVGATGRVTPVVGPALAFELTEVTPGVSWSWRVLGVPATSHTVDDLGDARCRVGFGVPTLAAPYLAVCRVALRRIETVLAGT